MAKRSTAKSIMMKQSSAYKAQRSSAPSIHQIDGSSKREASRSSIKALKSWTIGRSGVSDALLDRIAEEKMNQGYSLKRNPICSTCYIQKSSSGLCGYCD